MSFRFPLATVLRLREIAEEREERLLGQILNQMAQHRQTLEDLDAKHAQLIQHRERELRVQVSAAELLVLYRQMRAVEDLQTKTAEQLAQLDTLRQQQMKAYETAHRKKELLAGMREEHLDDYRLTQVRQEQSMLDDNFSSRRARR